MDWMDDCYEERAALLKALSHPLRLYIVRNMMHKKCNVSKIQHCLGIPQATVSQHLATLRAAGIIQGTRCGNEICYEVISEFARAVALLAVPELEAEKQENDSERAL